MVVSKLSEMGEFTPGPPFVHRALAKHTSFLLSRMGMIAMKQFSQRLDVGRFKELTGVSRKYAIPLLEYLDRERVTKRVGEERLIL